MSEPEVYYIAMRVTVVNPERFRGMVGDDTKPMLQILRDEIVSNLEDVGVDADITEALDVTEGLRAELRAMTDRALLSYLRTPRPAWPIGGRMTNVNVAALLLAEVERRGLTAREP
jgi:hypothetical protein